MIIGLNGLKGSGKDTVGSYLVEEYGFENRSFAKLLKESAASLFDIHPSSWEEWKNDENMRVTVYHVDRGSESEITVREFLQRYGTEAHRSIFGADFWVNHAMKGIDPNKNYVFTDARFENELERIKSHGGYNVQILRPSIFIEDTHVSESRPPQHMIDYAIDNDKGFDELYTQVDEFVDWLEVESRLVYENN